MPADKKAHVRRSVLQLWGMSWKLRGLCWCTHWFTWIAPLSCLYPLKKTHYCSFITPSVSIGVKSECFPKKAEKEQSEAPVSSIQVLHDIQQQGIPTTQTKCKFWWRRNQVPMYRNGSLHMFFFDIRSYRWLYLIEQDDTTLVLLSNFPLNELHSKIWALAVGLNCCFPMQHRTDGGAAQKLPPCGLNTDTAQGDGLPAVVLLVLFLLYPLRFRQKAQWHIFSVFVSVFHHLCSPLPVAQWEEMKCANLAKGSVFHQLSVENVSDFVARWCFAF